MITGNINKYALGLNILIDHPVSLLSLNLPLVIFQHFFLQLIPFYKKYIYIRNRKTCFIPHCWHLTQISRVRSNLKISQPSLQLIGANPWGPLSRALPSARQYNHTCIHNFLSPDRGCILQKASRQELG